MVNFFIPEYKVPTGFNIPYSKILVPIDTSLLYNLTSSSTVIGRDSPAASVLLLDPVRGVPRVTGSETGSPTLPQARHRAGEARGGSCWSSRT